MNGILHRYYERELRFLRQSAAEFAKQYPATAGRLLLEGGQSADPHVERMLEAFALLAGRIQHKLDDEFPELTDAILNTVYPHYLAPIPSMGIAQFEVDAKRAQSPTGFTIPRHSPLETQSIDDIACRYRTCYPVTLWQLAVADAGMLVPPFPRGLRPPAQTEVAIRLVLECSGAQPFAELAIENLRFHIAGDPSTVADLYELIFNNVSQVMFWTGDSGGDEQPILMDPEECISEVGFGPDEGMLPYPPASFIGYRLLTELFTFPRKFQFFDLRGLDRVRKAGFGSRLEVVFFLNRRLERIEQAVRKETFRLGCTPIVNLYPQVAEPINLTQARFQYPIVPDVTRPGATEVYQIDSVSSIAANGAITKYEGFYSIRHGRDEGNPRTFWYATRQPGVDPNSSGTEVELALVDLGFNPRLPADSVLSVRTLCTNGDWPVRLQMSAQQVRLRLEGSAPVSNLTTVGSLTRPIRPSLKRGAHWRLVSHLNLNYFSLTDGEGGREALCELLRLYDFTDGDEHRARDAVSVQLIDGIKAVRSRAIVAQTGAEVSSGFCRGTEITIDFDEDKYIGTGVYLVASVLERFFALYASINSFTQLLACSTNNDSIIKRWPPRAGEQRLT